MGGASQQGASQHPLLWKTTRWNEVMNCKTQEWIFLIFLIFWPTRMLTNQTLSAGAVQKHDTCSTQLIWLWLQPQAFTLSVCGQLAAVSLKLRLNCLFQAHLNNNSAQFGKEQISGLGWNVSMSTGTLANNNYNYKKKKNTQIKFKGQLLAYLSAVPVHVCNQYDNSSP